MNNLMMRSSNRTKVVFSNQNYNSIENLDYTKLSSELVSNRKDLRTISKESNLYPNTKNINDKSLLDIQKDSIIPIPGVLIEHEKSETDMKPPESNWVAPHGPQWNSMTI